MAIGGDYGNNGKMFVAYGSTGGTGNSGRTNSGDTPKSFAYISWSGNENDAGDLLSNLGKTLPQPFNRPEFNPFGNSNGNGDNPLSSLLNNGNGSPVCKPASSRCGTGGSHGNQNNQKQQAFLAGFIAGLLQAIKTMAGNNNNNSGNNTQNNGIENWIRQLISPSSSSSSIV